MGAGISYVVTGDEQVEHRLLGMAARSMNFSPVLGLIAEDMADKVDEQFDEGQGNWAPLAPATVAQKAREGLDPRILHATVSMRRSFADEGHPDHVEHVTDSELLFGSSDPKAPLHQAGTSRMPARRILDFTPANFRVWSKMIQAYLIGLEGGLGQGVPVWLR
jgi:phage gpG-like protein